MYMKQALAIGNDAYTPSYLDLPCCVNDARDLTRSLHSMGFKTQCATDVNLHSMKSITYHFINSIRPGAIVMFYFSGHGVQHDGNNYLIPTDAIGVCADNIKSTALDVAYVINAMYEKRPRLVICILDCCRTNPPIEPIKSKSIDSRALDGTKAGFAPMQGPPSTIIIYACAADDTAAGRSKNGRNSLYTYHLLRHIRTPNVDIETILRYVAVDVKKESNYEQIPFRYSSCNESIYLLTKHAWKGSVSSEHKKRRSIPKSSSKEFTKGSATHHLRQQVNDSQHRSTDQSHMPLCRRSVSRNSSSNTVGTTLRSASPFIRNSHHHRR